VTFNTLHAIKEKAQSKKSWVNCDIWYKRPGETIEKMSNKARIYL
jgi:hypothetical protein